MNTTERARCDQSERQRLWARITSADAANMHGLRRQLTAALTRWVDADVVDTTALLSSELLGNALQHACTPRGGCPWVTLSALLVDNCLRVEVTDPDPRLPQRHEAGSDDEHGRGLELMDALAGDWGVCPRTVGKTVWFTVVSTAARTPEHAA